MASGNSSLDEPEQHQAALRHLGLNSGPDNVEPILRKRQYVLQVSRCNSGDGGWWLFKN